MTVHVKNVIFGRRFIPHSQRPKHLECILFGRGDDVFLTHAITGPPDVDQLIQVTLDQNIVDEGLLGGPAVTIPSRSNNAKDRISMSDGTVEGILHFGEGTSIHGENHARSRVLSRGARTRLLANAVRMLIRTWSSDSKTG